MAATAAAVIVLLAAALVAQGAIGAWRTARNERDDAEIRQRLLNQLITLQARDPALAQRAVEIGVTAAFPTRPSEPESPPRSAPTIHTLGPRPVPPIDTLDDDALIAKAEQIQEARIRRALDA